jgi:type III pantothenate kinase
VVVDCGTAITVDSVSEKGQFLGGVISIGARTMISALKAKAPHLSSGAMNYSGVLNLDTQNAIDSGALIFIAGGIERVLKEVESSLGSGFPVVMTGGSASAIAPLIDGSVDIRLDLVLRGMQVVIEAGF